MEPTVVSSASAQAPTILPAKGGLRDYVFFGVIDWHFRHQRPQQLAIGLAKSGRRVFYVSVNFVDNADAGYAIEQLDPTLALYQIQFNVKGPLSVYAQLPSAAQFAQLQGGLRHLLNSAQSTWGVHVIQHPFWYRLAAFVPSARTVYDCMDFHAGFSNTAKEHDAVELRMMQTADLTVVTSGFLEDFARGKARRVELIRNAAEFDHFHVAYQPRAAPNTRPVIGYYGAIAEWFDVALLETLAQRFSHCDFQLVGNDTASVGLQLRKFSNVTMLGERPYAELPQWLQGFDVCLIPFQVNQLTLATNPVKVYEYLSACKAVVSTDLPELRQFGDLVYRAAQADAFAQQVQAALDERAQGGYENLCQRRMDFVRQQTWEQRATMLARAAEDTGDEPLVSVVVVSYNQWHLTERCLHSLLSQSDQVRLEVIVVDNDSKDETPARLTQWCQQAPERLSVILNAENKGFGGAVNQGLAAARGDYLVVLNNDTVVGPGWARGMRRHFESDPKLGLICPITNNIGNEAQVALAGTTVTEVFASARNYALVKTGTLLPLDNVAFFCVMMPRAVHSRVGGLDERFFPGFFEDDDYCLRVKQEGWTVGCAEDVFVYHELSASFGKEEPAHRKAIFDRNKRLFEEKWGAWKPHVYRAESLPR
jgi:GT2 family glycosyltransferase/glycosyltransferase involved in cell wall biosynthesis